MILEMASDSLGDRVAVGPLDGGLTFAELGHRARRAGTWLAAQPGDRVVLVDENSPAGADRPVRIGDRGEALRAGELPAGRRPAALDRRAGGARRSVIAGAGVAERLAGVDGIEVVSRDDFLATVRGRVDRRRPTAGAATPTPPPCCCSPAAPPASRRPPCSGT